MRFIDIDRNQLPSILNRGNLIGIELGVASGDFSKRMIDTGIFNKFYGVDVYGDHHDVSEYKYALKHIGLEKPYTLLRMTFDDAHDLFEDEFFDFVYIDGYAHTGEEGGKTIFDWYKKVKVGGMIAGHDYDPEWPAVMKAVDTFAQQANLETLVTTPTKNPGPQDRHPSWAALKTRHIDIRIPENLSEEIKPLLGHNRKRDRLLVRLGRKFKRAIRKSC